MKEQNIFKELRLKRTEQTVMQREGKKTAVKKPLSQSALARELGINQATVSEAENLSIEKGQYPAIATLVAYSKYFHVPYSTLLGETDTEKLDNIKINKEYGLTDKALATIKNLSPVARSMLNVFLSNSSLGNDSRTGYNNVEHFFYSLADIGYSMVNRLAEVSPDKDHLNKDDDVYRLLRQKMADLFMDYMHTLKMGDLINVLVQIEKQEQWLDEYRDSEENIRDMEEYMQENH